MMPVKISELVERLRDQEGYTPPLLLEAADALSYFLAAMQNGGEVEAFLLELEDGFISVEAFDKVADFARAQALRIASLEHRLEIDRCYEFVGGESIEKVVPQEDRASFPDGITCRDATIRLQDEKIDVLAARLDSATTILKGVQDSYGKGTWLSVDAFLDTEEMK